MLDEEVNRPHRVNRPQHFWIADNAVNTQYRQHQKPQQHHWGKKFADQSGSVFLNEEQQGKNKN